VEAVADIAKARADRAQAPAPVSVKSLRNLECISAGEFARWIKLTTPNDRTRVIRMLRACADILEAELQDGKVERHVALDSLVGIAGIDREAGHA
jgi:hypothetical protein